MKTLPARLLRYLLIASVPAFAFAGSGDLDTLTAKLSQPSQPSTLRVDMPWADIKVEAVDGDTVSVSSTITKRTTKVDRPGGLRRLDNDVSFELVEKDNVVVLSLVGDGARGARDAEFKVSVPRAMALDIKTSIGGEISVKNVEGDINIEGLNGEVKLDGIAGAAVVNTMNGEVTANYAKVPVKPINIVSMNGEVTVRVPTDTKANVSLRSHNGSILTDFDEDALKTKTEGKSTSTYSYTYRGDSEAARLAARDAAREATIAAKAAVHEAMQIAKEVADEVQRSIAEADAENAPTPAAAPAPAPAKPAKKLTTARAPRAPMGPITGGKLVSGTLNGGGVDIKISTMNGEITLRQTK